MTWGEKSEGKIGTLRLLACLVAQSCLTLCDPVHFGQEGSSVHGIFLGKSTTGVGLPFPPPGDLPDPVIEPVSPVSPVLVLEGGFFTP